MTRWRLLKTPELSGLENMRIDLDIFKEFEKGNAPSTLRTYSWQPKCLSLGYAQNPDEVIDAQRAKELGWDLVGRPTGGGIVFHNEAEVTYSLVTGLDNPALPKGLVPSYMKISEAVVGVLGKIGIRAEIRKQKTEREEQETESRKQKHLLCFSYPTEYEIVVGGKKIAGSAQKRGKRALLQQGSIFVRNNFDDVFSVLKEPVDWEWYTSRAISVEEILGREVKFEELCEALIAGFSSVLHFGL